MLLLWVPNALVWMRRCLAIWLVFAACPRPRIFLAGAGRYVKTGRKERPNTACTRYDKFGDTVTIFDSKSGQPRAKIGKTAPGNAEKLAP
jgi:hypothetical protein